MLKTLYIKNYALIDELTLGFDAGLTILTGETGAGKSIIIDALSMILGERADTGSVRKGSDKAIVEAIFNISLLDEVKKMLVENGIESPDELILRREISLKSQSRCFINDSPATIIVLKQLGDLLVDLHGQHEHQSLLRTETHIDLLDDFCNLKEQIVTFGKAYTRANSILKAKGELLSQQQRLNEQRSLYEYQLNEINAVDPQEHEEEQLERELKILENSERLSAECNQLYDLLYDGEHSVIENLGKASSRIEVLRKIDAEFESAGKEIESAHSIVDELSNFIREYRSRIEFKPERLDEIRTRLGQISLLKKKYGGTIETLLRHKEKAERELKAVENFDTELSRIEQEFLAAKKNCSDLALKLSQQRQEGAKKLNKKIAQTLAQLGIQHARFETAIAQEKEEKDSNALVEYKSSGYKCSAKGMDRIEFFISTNVGESPKPLVKVASGGEVSRIMLSLKMNVVGEEQVPLLIFDEIDVGISGRIAQSVAQAMKQLAKRHQVIAITHLPQIAGFADTHIVVEKIEDGKRAATRVRKLAKQERITEVARLMSGEEVTKAGLQSARELIELSTNE